MNFRIVGLHGYCIWNVYQDRAAKEHYEKAVQCRPKHVCVTGCIVHVLILMVVKFRSTCKTGSWSSICIRIESMNYIFDMDYTLMTTHFNERKAVQCRPLFVYLFELRFVVFIYIHSLLR